MIAGRHDEPGGTAGGPREGPLDRGVGGRALPPRRRVAQHRGGGDDHSGQEGQEEVLARRQVREEEAEGGGGARLAGRGQTEEAVLVEHLRGGPTVA